MDLTGVYVVAGYSDEPDGRNGGTMTRITLWEIRGGKPIDTYVCPANRNSRLWRTVLDLRKWGCIIGNVRPIQRNGKTLADADLEPEILWTGDLETLAQKIESLHTPTGGFPALFEVQP